MKLSKVAILALLLTSAAQSINVDQVQGQVKKHSFIAYNGGQMLLEDLRNYKFSDIKNRLVQIDNELAQFDAVQKDDGPQSDNIYSMLPDIQHKSDADFMD